MSVGPRDTALILYIEQNHLEGLPPQWNHIWLISELVSTWTLIVAKLTLLFLVLFAVHTVHLLSVAFQRKPQGAIFIPSQVPPLSAPTAAWQPLPIWRPGLLCPCYNLIQALFPSFDHRRPASISSDCTLQIQAFSVIYSRLLLSPRVSPNHSPIVSEGENTIRRHSWPNSRQLWWMTWPENSLVLFCHLTLMVYISIFYRITIVS